MTNRYVESLTPSDCDLVSLITPRTRGCSDLGLGLGFRVRVRVRVTRVRVTRNLALTYFFC